MTFQHPAITLLLFAIPILLAVRLWRHRANALYFSPLQARLSRLSLSFLPVLLLEGLVLTAAVVLAAGPVKEKTSTELSEEGIDIMLVLDVSASMQAADFKPNRLEALKKISKDFIRQSAGNRIGVLVFTLDVFNQSPMTTDHLILEMLIDGIHYEMIDHGRSGGTAIGDAMVMATDTLNRMKIKGRDQAIILITDGESNAGLDPVLAARGVRDAGLNFYLIGIGDRKPIKVYIYGQPFINLQNQHLETQLADESLKKIAIAAGGEYYRAIDENALARTLTGISRLEKSPLRSSRVTTVSDNSSSMAILLAICFSLWLLLNFLQRRPFR